MLDFWAIFEDLLDLYDIYELFLAILQILLAFWANFEILLIFWANFEILLDFQALSQVVRCERELKREREWHADRQSRVWWVVWGVNHAKALPCDPILSNTSFLAARKQRTRLVSTSTAAAAT